MLTENYLRSRTPGLIGYGEYQKSAVMIPLIEKEDGTHVLFEVRSGRLENQPGEICFPGGRMEHEETPEETALRETMEELLIGQDQLHILGPGDIFISPAGVMIYPYIGRIGGYQGTYSKDEVQEIFTVPLSFFLHRKPQQYNLKVKTVPGPDFPYEMVRGGKAYTWKEGVYQVVFYQYQEKIIWGMTAKIMRAAAELLIMGENKSRIR